MRHVLCADCSSLTMLTFTLAASLVVSHAPQQAPQVNPSLFCGDAVAQHRPAPRRADEGGGRPCRASPTPSTSAWCNGGVWKTTDAGRTWKPIFDDQPTGSIGSIAVAPSDPNIIYVGSGEGLPRPDLAVGDGIYKSTDAGKTWTHLGLRDAQQIPKIAVDPEEPESAVRRRARPSVRPERGARHLPLDRRRPDVPAGALQGREHRRQGRRHRSVQPGHRLRDDVGGAAGSVGERRVERHPRRHLQVDRRRHDLEAADAGPAGRRRQRRARDRAEQPEAALRDASRRRGNGTGHLSLGRRRRDLDAQHDRHASDQPHQRGGAARRPEESRLADRHRHRQLQVDRRRQDVGAVQGRARRRRLPERLVEPEQPRHHAARRSIRARSSR